ncbi:hypothetical protein AVEN_231073-1 [Araneus ventricosus]|uniref:Uncharacterized protein n=1 Tax=Araneus ventricosus TaxID=182803 RepID=A0A4Y2A3S7_ARAVE|nr:hypothetical protein AVEN_231073-1 [Araneus ventricosus]
MMNRLYLWQKAYVSSNDFCAINTEDVCIYGRDVIKRVLMEAQGLRNSTQIFTDSMSVLKSLEAVNDQFQIIKDIKNILKSVNCSFHWVKVYVGTHGNERADILEKEATGKDSVDVYLGVPNH